jgi:hypothetical protein
MRMIFDIPTKVAERLLGYIAEGSTEPEIVVKVRLVHRREEPQAPHVLWEVEFLPNNSGIYRMLLEGGDK